MAKGGCQGMAGWVVAVGEGGRGERVGYECIGRGRRWWDGFDFPLQVSFFSLSLQFSFFTPVLRIIRRWCRPKKEWGGGGVGGGVGVAFVGGGV